MDITRQMRLGGFEAMLVMGASLAIAGRRCRGCGTRNHWNN